MHTFNREVNKRNVYVGATSHFERHLKVLADSGLDEAISDGRQLQPGMRCNAKIA